MASTSSNFGSGTVLRDVRAAKTLNDPADGRCFRFLVFGLLEVDIMDDASDMSDAWIRDGESIAQRLEGAIGAMVPEFGFERVKGNSRGNGSGLAEHETGVGIDETTNQPGR